MDILQIMHHKFTYTFDDIDGWKITQYNQPSTSIYDIYNSAGRNVAQIDRYGKLWIRWNGRLEETGKKFDIKLESFLKNSVRYVYLILQEKKGVTPTHL